MCCAGELPGTLAAHTAAPNWTTALAQITGQRRRQPAVTQLNMQQAEAWSQYPSGYDWREQSADTAQVR